MYSDAATLRRALHRMEVCSASIHPMPHTARSSTPRHARRHRFGLWSRPLGCGCAGGRWCMRSRDRSVGPVRLARPRAFGGTGGSLATPCGCAGGSRGAAVAPRDERGDRGPVCAPHDTRSSTTQTQTMFSRAHLRLSLETAEMFRFTHIAAPIGCRVSVVFRLPHMHARVVSRGPHARQPCAQHAFL